MLSLLVPESGLYQLVVVLHVVAVVGGFGSIVLNRTGKAPPWAEPLMYAVPVLGIVALLLSEDRWQFSQPWVSASFLIYVAAIGVYHSGVKKGGPKAATMGAAFDLLVVLAIAVMVVKPGA
ncbi:MAG: hypothetical protein ACRD0Q_06840 [Acidimicrobiales bacterium]